MRELNTAAMTAAVGTEIFDINLSDADEETITSIAHLVAERGVVVLRNQTLSPEEQCEVGRKFGELANDGEYQADGLPSAIKVVHVDRESEFAVGDGWHSDRPVVERPPALTILRIETVPRVGGDTAYSSMYAAYNTLSDPMKEFLVGKTAVFTGDRYRTRMGGSGSNVEFQLHPVVRTHPVTKKRALYVSRLFTKAIKELSEHESDAILRCLFEHIDRGVSFQTRVVWEPNTIAIWDNRCVQHHAIWDYYPETRHGYRLTTVGEQPYLE